MSIKWGQLLDVVAVSLGSTVAVVVLVGVALLGLSARTAPPMALVTAREGVGQDGTGAVAARRAALPPAAGTVVAAVCLAAAGAIVLFGLWVLVVR